MLYMQDAAAYDIVVEVDYVTNRVYRLQTTT